MQLTTNFRHRNVVCLLRGQTQELSKPKQFIYVLHLVPRLHSDSNWTKEDNTVLERHLSRFKEAIKLGHLILAGRTQEPGDRTFGIAILEAADEAAARALRFSRSARLRGRNRGIGAARMRFGSRKSRLASRLLNQGACYDEM